MITGSFKEDADTICWLFLMVKWDQLTLSFEPISGNHSDAPAIDLKSQKVDLKEKSWLRNMH
jgi:hypothetical protein